MNLHQGMAVSTPNGAGKIIYVRNAPPDYSKVASVSVMLNSRKNELKYTGTIFKAEDVSPLKSCAQKLREAYREENPIQSDIKKREDMCNSCRNPLTSQLDIDNMLCERMEK